MQIGFDGYAIGGVSVGEPEPEMMQAVEWSEPFLPNDKPRYAMGLGTPPQMLELIARGVDMFDCVLPTRLARNGTAFTAGGTLNLKNAEFTLQNGPIEEGCTCPACRDFSRGYLRHLLKAEEILGLRLVTLHNLHFYLDLDPARAGSDRGGNVRAVSPRLCRRLSQHRRSDPLTSLRHRGRIPAREDAFERGEGVLRSEIFFAVVAARDHAAVAIEHEKRRNALARRAP